MLMACDASVLSGKKVPASIAGWHSFKLPRSLRVFTGSRMSSMFFSIGRIDDGETILHHLKNSCSSLREARDQLHAEECAMVTDCKGLFDAVKRSTVQQVTDKRVATEGLLIKDMLRDLNCH